MEYLEGLVIRLIELPELLGSHRKKVRKRTWKIVDDIVMPKVWDFVDYDDYHGVFPGRNLRRHIAEYNAHLVKRRYSEAEKIARKLLREIRSY